MPTTIPTDIREYGAYGMFLLIAFMFVWKGVPVFTKWLNGLLDTFKEEIQRERDLGQRMLSDERERNAKSESAIRDVIERNTTAVNSLERTVQRLADKS